MDARLRRLDLSTNFIRQLHTLALPYLEQLDLSSNQLDLISERAFERVTRLEGLNLSRNLLSNNFASSSKALRSISQLRTLDLSANALGDDAAERFLRNKPFLDQLWMSGNVLTRLSRNLFNESRRLRHVALDNNMISVIEQGTFEPLSTLETINLAKNNLAFICDFKLYRLKHLNLSGNSIEFFVTHEDSKLYRLETLDLSHNKLLYFPILPKMSDLKYLHLQNNMIGALGSEAEMVVEVNALYNGLKQQRYVMKNNLHANWRLVPLVYIDLSYNHFRSFPLETLAVLSSLQTLNFSHNCLRNLTWSVRGDDDDDSGDQRQLFFTSLTHLDMQSNGLGFISPLFLNGLTRIETWNLQDNAVQPCAPVGHLQNLQMAQSVNPKTSCVFFEQLRTLKHLNLKENSIEVLYSNAFQGSSLVSLNLARNPNMQMQAGALSGLQSTLQSLVLSEMNLTSAELSLPCMPALSRLNLSRNNLHTLPTGLRCSPLMEMDLRKNHFVSLNRSLLGALSAHLTAIYVSGNSFNCCESEWLVALRDMKIELPDISDTVCFIRDREILMTQVPQQTSPGCSFHPNTLDAHSGHVVLVVVFVAILATVVIVIVARKLCCTESFFKQKEKEAGTAECSTAMG